MNRKKIMIGMVTHRINQGNKGVLIVSSRKFHRANMLKIPVRAIGQIDEGILCVSDYRELSNQLS